ncbi:MAG: hypothetical protein COB04_18465 [Gammaproteobacteria bacterium]|nr:MAG: hypothetical protein COB04_18370 [Gammaproteobacteria bacterium]PCJ11961.1 MAG: hypothetical protein COB04_18465 [Gammaproteobacteria bacterium]
MAKPVNETIGHVLCSNRGCSEQAAIRQSRKAGHYFYLVCPECGMNQQTKAWPQNYIWHRAAWVPGAQVLKPSNVDDNWRFDEGEGFTQAKPIRVPDKGLESIPEDWCPINEPESENTLGNDSTSDKPGRSGLAGAVVLLLTFVGAIWATI